MTILKHLGIFLLAWVATFAIILCVGMGSL